MNTGNDASLHSCHCKSKLLFHVPGQLQFLACDHFLPCLHKGVGWLPETSTFLFQLLHLELDPCRRSMAYTRQFAKMSFTRNFLRASRRKWTNIHAGLSHDTGVHRAVAV